MIIVSLPLKYLNFNSHAHVERDASWINKIVAKFDFNSHAHVERDALLKFSLCQIIGISTHTLTWSVTGVARPFMYNTKISTHTLTWSVTFAKLYGFSISINFNSHAHVERDKIIFRKTRIFKISTHTLTWSVTTITGWVINVPEFQLTRSRGA